MVEQQNQKQSLDILRQVNSKSNLEPQHLKQRAASSVSEEGGLSANGSQLRLHHRQKSPARIQDSFQNNRNSYSKQQIVNAKANETQGEGSNNKPVGQGINKQVYCNKPGLELNSFDGVNDLQNKQNKYARQLLLLQQNKDLGCQVTSPVSMLAFSTQLLDENASFTPQQQHQKTQINTGGSQQEDLNESGPWTIRQDVMESQMTNNQMAGATEPDPQYRPITPKQIFCVESSDQEELLQEKLSQQIGNYNHHIHQMINSGESHFQINQQQWQAQQTTVSPIQQNSHQAISSGAIIFDKDSFKYSGDYGATKRLRGSQIISPKNRIKEVRWQQRTAGTALYKNQKIMDNLKHIFSPSSQNTTQNQFKNGKAKDSKRNSHQQLASQDSQTSGPPCFKSHQRALTAHIALQRSHQKMKALALKQKQTSFNQKVMAQQSAPKLGSSSLSKERNRNSQKAHTKSSKLLLMNKNKEVLQQQQQIQFQQQEQLLQQQIQQQMISDDIQDNVEQTDGQDGVVVVHSTRTAVGSKFLTSQNGNSQRDDFNEVQAYEEPKQMIFREQITVTSKSREREGGDTTTNAEQAMVLARDAKIISDGQQSFSRIINSQNSGSPRASVAIVVNQSSKRASVIDLNQMAQNQLPLRSTSQMENMVNLGGSYEGIPNDIDLQNQQNEQQNQLNQVFQQQMNDSGGKLSEYNGQMIDLQTNLNRLDSSPLVNLSSGGIDNDDLLPAQYQAVDSGAFILATNSDQLLMQHLSKIKQETSLKRLISARQQPTNSMTSTSQNRQRQRKNTAHHLRGNTSISKQGYSILVQQPSSINDANIATNRHNSFMYQQLQQQQPQLAALDSQSMNHHYNKRQRSLHTASVVILNNNQNMNPNNQTQFIQQQPLNHSQTANQQILMENNVNDGLLQAQQDQSILGRNRYKGRLMSFQGMNNNNNMGALRQSLNQVNSPSITNSNFDQKNHSVGQYTFQELDENEQGGRVVYQVQGDKNNKGSEKVIVRVKQSARDRNNYSRKSVKSAMTRKSGQQASYQIMRDRNPNLQNNNLNRKCLDMKVGSLSTQSNCTFRDMVYVSQDNQTLNELTKNFKQDLSRSRQQRTDNNFLQTQDIPATQQILQSAVKSSNLGSSQILFNQIPYQEEEKQPFSRFFKQQKVGGRNFDRKKSLTQRQIRIQQQYERRQTLNLQNNMQRKYSHQQKLVQKQQDIQLEKQQRLQFAIELSNSQVLDYANLIADQSKKQTLDQIHDSQTNLTNNSPLKVITEDNGSSFNMAPQNLYARKSSAMPSGTQNLSEAFQQSLVTNNISELADQTHKILVIKPPDVEFKMKNKPPLVDMDKVDYTRYRSSEHHSKRQSEQEGQIGRIQSMKGINWGMGMNQSIDINTDKLRLSATGKDANIISYRKLSKQIQLNSSEQALNHNRRTPSAKVTSNPRKRINTRQEIDVDLNSRVIEDSPPNKIIEASPNTIYKSDQYGSHFKSNLLHSKSPAVAKEFLDYPQMIDSSKPIVNSSNKPFDSKNNNLPYMPGLSPRRSLKSTKTKSNNLQQLSGGLGQSQPVSSSKPNSPCRQKPQQSYEFPSGDNSIQNKNNDNTNQMRSSAAEMIVFRASESSVVNPVTDQMLKQNESALSPTTIHNFLDSKYQEEQNRLMAQNDGSTDRSKTNSNQIRLQQSSTMLKKNSMTNILPQEQPTTFVFKQMPINTSREKIASGKHSNEQLQQKQTDDAIQDHDIHLQDFIVGTTKAILIRKPNSTNNVNKDALSSKIFPSSGGIIKKPNKILVNKDDQGTTNGGTAKHAQAMAISNNSSIIAAHSPTFKKVKSERAHYNQQTTEELQPAITPLSLVEVSVKRHRKRDSGFVSRQNSKPLSSNRNNINSNRSKRKILSNGKVLSSANSRTGANLQHVYLRDRYELGNRDMHSNEDDQRDRHHTLVESSIVGGIQGFQISPAQKTQNK